MAEIDVRWIKIATGIFDDDKILLIESMPEKDSILVIWFKLLALAGKQNNSGVFMMGKTPYTEAMFATIFRRDESIVHNAFEIFLNFGMLEQSNGVFSIPNWGKHQSLDQLESKNEYMKNYMKKYREKQKNLSSVGCKTNSKFNGKSNSKSNVRQAEKKREEQIREEQIRGEEEGEISPATPSLPRITEFVKINDLSVNPNRFFSYYNERDWKTSKGTPIDWKAKIREWDFDDKQKTNATAAETRSTGNPFLDLALDLAREENLI